MNPPIKRHPSLQPISRDHHQGLLLCWKIRQGLAKQVPLSTITDYTLWFYTEHLVPHFKIEEQDLFPILGNTHPLVKVALEEHTLISSLMNIEIMNEQILNNIADAIEKHIRFEERELFNVIQREASEEQLENLKIVENETTFCDNPKFNFWI